MFKCNRAPTGRAGKGAPPGRGVSPDPREWRGRVGLVAGLVELETDWSGVPAGLARGFRELGFDVDYVDATPWTTAGRVVHRWLRAIGKDRGDWMLRPEFVSLARMSGAVRRLRMDPGVTAWVHMGAPVIGRPLRHGRYVTFEDMTVAQLRQSGQWWRGGSDRHFRRSRRLQSAVYRHARACCVASSWAKRSLMTDFGVPEEKIRVVGLGRHVTLPSPPTRDWSEPRFLFVGRAWVRKNGDGVVRAFSKLREERPNARLDLVGKDPGVSAPGVHHHGELDANDASDGALLQSLYARATCFVMPSFTEPFAIAYLEAAGAGLPVIATTVGGISDALGADGALYVDPHNDEAILDAMRQLSDPVAAEAMGAAGRHNSERFTWRNVAEQVLAASQS